MEANGKPGGGKKVSTVPGARAVVAWAARRDGSGVDWTAVDGRLLAAALSVCVGAEVGLTFGAAQGGRGVVLTPYQHPVRYERQYAATAVELEELLWAVIDSFASPSEDIAVSWSLERR